MNEIIVVVVLVAEILTVLQCLQIAFMQELKFDKYMAIIIVADILLYSAITFGLLPKICSVLFYVLVFVYCYFKFKQKMAKTVICFIIGVSLGGCIEAIVACVFISLIRILDNNIILFLSSLCALVFSYIAKTCIPVLKIKKMNNEKKWLFYCVILYGISYTGLVADYYLNKTLIKIYAVFILLFLVIIVFYLYKLVQARAEIDLKNRELELQNIYGEMYKNLLGEVRRKQHDYKNQLNTIYSMHMVLDSRDELGEMQREYLNELQINQKYESIVTNCSNHILAGYFYYRFLLCEKNGIEINYNIAINQAECCFALHEIIELLGILIDNACEKVLEEENGDKKVHIEFIESNEFVKISISNPAEYLSYSEIDRIFEEGYSSKGENRGLGLARCMELINKYNAEIVVQNIQCKEDNWIKFEVNIIK